jgi:hypothetical protein
LHLDLFEFLYTLLCSTPPAFIPNSNTFCKPPIVHHQENEEEEEEEGDDAEDQVHRKQKINFP